MSFEQNPGKVWERIKGELQAQLPRQVYWTWVADAEAVDYSRDVLTISVGNSYARDEILKLSQIARIAAGIVGRDVDIRVVTPGDEIRRDASPDNPRPRAAESAVKPPTSPGGRRPASEEPRDEPPIEPGAAVPADTPVELRPEYLREYDRVVRPERIIAVPLYYLRWIPYLGVELAWLPVAFRQVAYLRGIDYKPGEIFQASGKEVAAWAGMSLRTFRRRVNDPLLKWFILPEEPEGGRSGWSIGEDSIPHREPARWRVVMSMPMTPADQERLATWLQLEASTRRSRAEVLRAARETPVERLINRPHSAQSLPPEVAGTPVSVEDVIRDALKLDQGDRNGPIDLLVNSLVHHITGEALLVTHYFVREWLPVIGGAPGWFVTLMRSMAAGDVGESEVVFEGGYAEIAERLGLGNPWRIARWLREENTGPSSISAFVEEVEAQKASDQRVSRRFRIKMYDPYAPHHLDQVEAPGDLAPDILKAPARSGQLTPRGTDTHGEVAPRGSDMNEFADAREIGIHAGEEARDFDTDGPEGPRETGITNPQPSTSDPQTLREAGTVKRGGGSYRDYQERDTTTSSLTDARVADSTGWNMQTLLGNAGVASSARDSLKRASPQAFVSWMLYAASARGASIVDPIGHAVSRLREDPYKGAGGAFDRLVQLAPDALVELIARDLADLGTARFSNRDWGSVMEKADRERLSLVAHVLGGEVDPNWHWWDASDDE
jgi:hypothetical protein